MEWPHDSKSTSSELLNQEIISSSMISESNNVNGNRIDISEYEIIPDNYLHLFNFQQNTNNQTSFLSDHSPNLSELEESEDDCFIDSSEVRQPTLAELIGFNRLFAKDNNHNQYIECNTKDSM